MFANQFSPYQTEGFKGPQVRSASTLSNMFMRFLYPICNTYIFFYICVYVSVQFSSVTHSCPTLCDPMDCSTPGFPIHHQLLELTQTRVIKSVMPSNHLILCSPLLLLPSIFPGIKVFANQSDLPIKWPKRRSFTFSISHSNEYSGLISFRMHSWMTLMSKGLSKIFSNTTVQKHQFYSTQLSLWSNFHIHT